MRKSALLFTAFLCTLSLLFSSCTKAPDAAADDRPHMGVDTESQNTPSGPDSSDSERTGNLNSNDSACDVQLKDETLREEADGGKAENAGFEQQDEVEDKAREQNEVQMKDASEAIKSPVPVVTMPIASGEIVYGTDAVVIDASHTDDGYVMIRYTEGTDARIKALITFPDGTLYQYNLIPEDTYAAFPLSGGSGTYNIGVYKNVEGTKYATLYTVALYAELIDEFSPFLQPNQYVNYSAESEAVLLAAELTAGLSDELDVVAAIYQYTISNITYDFDKAASVKSGYLPDIDTVLESGKGICFDYAALMTAMLRSRSIPTKLVVGYAGDIYHAWISVYTRESGWIDGVIVFDGMDWKLMDPTFASSGDSSEEIMAYIENTANYAAKYLY